MRRYFNIYPSDQLTMDEGMIAVYVLLVSDSQVQYIGTSINTYMATKK